MNIRSCIKLIAIFILTTAFISCTSGKMEGSNENVGKGKVVLKIGVFDFETRLKDLISEFNTNHRAISIVPEEIKDYDTYKNKLITRLAVGEGPDIIRVEPGMLSAVHKIAGSGLLYDINKLIEKDKDFKLSDYNKKVLDSGVFDGKRIFIPLGYNFRIFYAKRGVLEENGFITDGMNWTLKYLSQKATQFAEDNKKTGKKFMGVCNSQFSDIVKFSGMEFVDFEKRKACLCSKEFLDLLSIYKELYLATCNCNDITFNATPDINSNLIDWTIDGIDESTVLALDNSGAPWQKSKRNLSMNVYLFPTYSGKKSIMLEPMTVVGINARTKYKKEAFEFIKALLSEDYQSLDVKDGNEIICMPVNIKAYMKSVNFNIENLGGSAKIEPMDGSSEEKILKAREAQLERIENIGRCEMVDDTIYSIMNEEAKPFLEGKQTAAQTAQMMQDKVTIYLNE